MSKTSRYAWQSQQAVLNERLKGFLQNPNQERLDAVVEEMRNYADAARSGAIEIPQAFTTYG